LKNFKGGALRAACKKHRTVVKDCYYYTNMMKNE